MLFVYIRVEQWSHGKTSIGSWEEELEDTLSVNGAKNDKI